MLEKLLPSSFKSSVFYSVYKNVPFAKWGLRIWAVITLWDTIIGISPSQGAWSWTSNIPTFGDFVVMVFGVIPYWLWFYIPLVIFVGASLKYIGRELKEIREAVHNSDIYGRGEYYHRLKQEFTKSAQGLNGDFHRLQQAVKNVSLYDDFLKKEIINLAKSIETHAYSINSIVAAFTTKQIRIEYDLNFYLNLLQPIYLNEEEKLESNSMDTETKLWCRKAYDIYTTYHREWSEFNSAINKMLQPIENKIREDSRKRHVNG